MTIEIDDSDELGDIARKAQSLSDRLENALDAFDKHQPELDNISYSADLERGKLRLVIRDEKFTIGRVHRMLERHGWQENRRYEGSNMMMLQMEFEV